MKEQPDNQNMIGTVLALEPKGAKSNPIYKFVPIYHFLNQPLTNKLKYKSAFVFQKQYGENPTYKNRMGGK